MEEGAAGRGKARLSLALPAWVIPCYRRSPAYSRPVDEFGRVGRLGNACRNGGEGVGPPGKSDLGVDRRSIPGNVKTTLPRKTDRALPTRRRRLKFGYDGQWWGVSPGLDPARQTYSAVSKGAWASLVFIAPLLVVYECAVAVSGGADPGSVRGAADLWIRQGLGWIGLKDPFWAPFLLIAGLLIQHVRERRDWRFAPVTLPGMALESAGYAVVLIGLGKLLDLGFAHLDGLPRLAVDGVTGQPFWLEFLGAGIYEEVLFRLVLASLMALVLALIGTPRILKAVVAMVASALVFALAHHLGAPGESFTWYAFIFRWTAGVFFAWVFLERGFGIAVGTHTAYDLLVGCLGWHL